MNTAPFSTLRVLLSGTVLVALLLSAMPLGAQSARRTASADSDTIFRKNWEVGLDLLGLVNENNVPKTSLFIRRTYAGSNHKSRAWRFRLGMDSEWLKGNDFEGIPTGEYNIYAPYFLIGHEWRHRLKRSTWYFATDVSGMYYYGDRIVYQGLNNYDEVKVRNLQLSANGVLGYQVHVFGNLSLGIESVLTVTYWDEHVDVKPLDGGAFGGFGGDDRYQLLTAIKPFMTINLFYSLQTHKKNAKK
jgi:hypothetical protein